jgi:hypothetical protein
MLFCPNHASEYRLAIEDNAGSQTGQGSRLSPISVVRIQTFSAGRLKSEFAPLVLKTASIALTSAEAGSLNNEAGVVGSFVTLGMHPVRQGIKRIPLLII